MDVLEEEGYCNCGRTYVDKKHRAKGEFFIFLGTRDMNSMSRVDKCPYCGWKGLVVPRMGLGCPEHGMWWYKKEEEKPLQEDTSEDKRAESNRQRRRNKRLNREPERTKDKKRKRLSEHVRPRQG